MIKNPLILITLIAMILFTIASKERGDEIIKLTIESPQKIIMKNEEVTFKARLTNLTDKGYTLYHGMPLISLYIRGKGDETPEGTFSTKVKSMLEPLGYIEQTLNIKALEPGEYILRSFSSFSIGDDTYELVCEEVPIFVKDK